MRIWRINVTRCLMGLFVMAMTSSLFFCTHEEPPPRFTYKVDGVIQKVTTIKAELRITPDFDREVRRLELKAETDNSQFLSLSIPNWDTANPPDEGVLEGSYLFFDSNGNPNEECVNLHSTPSSGFIICTIPYLNYFANGRPYFGLYDKNIDAQIVLKECNPGKHTVSGTFASKIADNPLVKIEGSFENVKYVLK